MGRYETLVNVLDTIREEAPAAYTSYNPQLGDINGLNNARSMAFIHLFLKVKGAITNFEERHQRICDGTQDGGLDAYYIDYDTKKLYLIQSKFQITDPGSGSRSISANDLIRMEIDRILRGETTDSRGQQFNDKVLAFQRLWEGISDHANYKYKTIFLGNFKNYTDEQIKRLIDGSDYEIYNFEKIYDDLVFPLCSGTYYNPKEIFITINLNNKEQSTLKQKIITSGGEYDIRIVFVPVEEIAKVLSKYKNSILKYNPRNYLNVAKNKVNKAIRDSIMNNTTNDFAIFNNGITVIADRFSLSETTGQRGRGQIQLTNPQIINGAQTAYTLSKIHEDVNDFTSVFASKEVLLKVIVLGDSDDAPNVTFIEKLSNATNKQSSVDEADRRSNELIQIQIQRQIYENYGFFYERKRGEFYNGLQNSYFNRNSLINRYEFIRAYYAFKGNPSEARYKGEEILFKFPNFTQIIDSPANYRKMFYSWSALQFLYLLEDQLKHNSTTPEFASISYGSSLRYGKMAVIAALGCIELDQNRLSESEISNYVKVKLKEVLLKWADFENTIKQKPDDRKYFVGNDFDMDSYYKGTTVNVDIKAFFTPNTIQQ